MANRSFYLITYYKEYIMKGLLVYCWLFLFLIFSSDLIAQPCASDDPTSPVGIVPTQEEFPGGDPQCEGGFRINNPSSGTYDLDAFGNQVQIEISTSPCGPVFTWTIIGGVSIDAVYAKGGTDQNVYDYSGENPRPTTDGYLHAPYNSSSGQYFGLSHIDFCFSYKLDVSKTALTSLTRTYEWEIDKSCDGPDTLNLNAGQAPYNYPFSWTATVVDSADTNWNVYGVIKVKNSTPFTVTIASITDVITGGFNVVPDCGVTFPYDLASGDSLECTYEQELPNADARTNKVVVISSTAGVNGDSASVNFDFDDATVNKVDSSITVTDDCNDPVTVYLHQSPYTEEYTCEIGPYTTEECGENEYVNRVSFETEDLEITGSDSCVVIVNVFGCDEACTLTPGYWKTHSQKGPAPYDEAWQNLGPLEEDTPFFLSGKTYYEVLWTSPQGNAYYILAHAYIAAELNILNGASVPPAVQAAFDYATDLFTNYTPEQIGALKGAAKNAVTSNAQILDDYNNGLTGPGHCSDDSNETSSKSAGDNSENNNQVEVQAEVIPDAYSLNQNYPNPFNPSTTISFGIPEAGHVTLKIYDLLGNEIVTLVSGSISAGIHNVTFDASNIPSGVYLYKLQAGSFIVTKKMILMK
jgi:hypothetical protein